MPSIETSTVLPKIAIIGRSTSHFTRVAVMFAHELGIPFELEVVHDMKRIDAESYGGNPTRKLPTLRVDGALVLGTENICRRLAQLAPRARRIVWPEELGDDVSRNAQELVWHCMTAQVQLIVGTAIAKLPADNLYFTKITAGFDGSLEWLDANVDEALRLLRSDRELSLFEVTLFCLLEHIAFRPPVSLERHAALRRFVADFGSRPSAQQTPYRLDPR